MTHLILHKVRGKPAFDIAEQMDVNGEMFWIIPTSGHRAYPYWHCKIEELGHYDFNQEYVALSEPAEWSPVPADWPDHYEQKEAPKGKGSGLNLMDFISIPPPKVKLVRRRI